MVIYFAGQYLIVFNSSDNLTYHLDTTEYFPKWSRSTGFAKNWTQKDLEDQLGCRVTNAASKRILKEYPFTFSIKPLSPINSQEFKPQDICG